MSIPPLKELPLDDLLNGLETGRPSSRSIWATWLKEESIYPGLSRARASDLYAAYLTWCFTKGSEFTGEPLTQTAFGLLMGAKFKKNVGRMGTSYLISRSPNPSIPQYIAAQIGPKPPR